MLCIERIVIEHLTDDDVKRLLDEEQSLVKEKKDSSMANITITWFILLLLLSRSYRIPRLTMATTVCSNPTGLQSVKVSYASLLQSSVYMHVCTLC